MSVPVQCQGRFTISAATAALACVAQLGLHTDEEWPSHMQVFSEISSALHLLPPCINLESVCLPWYSCNPHRLLGMPAVLVGDSATVKEMIELEQQGVLVPGWPPSISEYVLSC
jgi:hypothetical protein